MVVETIYHKRKTLSRDVDELGVLGPTKGFGLDGRHGHNDCHASLQHL